MAVVTPASTGPSLLAVGSYTSATGGRGAGVTLLPRDPRTGRPGRPAAVADCPSPSFLTAGPGGLVHAAHELDEGLVSTRRVDGDRWELLGEAPSGGASPCHLEVVGDLLLAANYGGGVGVLDLRDGVVSGLRTTLRGSGSGPDPERQEASHPHSVRRLGDRVAVCDLGTDEIRVHELRDGGGDVDAEPAQVLRLAPGTGPRHAAHRDGRLHVAGELDATVTSLTVRGGRLGDPVVAPAVAGPPAAPAPVRTYPSEIAVAPWGLVVANRGADVLTLHEVVDGVARPLRDVPIGAANPRHVAVVGHHLYVAAQDSDRLVHLALDDDLAVADRSEVEIGSPTCVLPL
ncbi:beta-propeller fold lactonase family protein [Kineococcus sp. SYSU DK001]|uniref:beta-propeller fold lactonase family protein n=1 Tax=Kineococcus sp. SYSU DK001 TaxID=3383122 RepID=UPI003D7E6E66